LTFRLPTKSGLAFKSHERLYTSVANGRRGWMTNSKKRGIAKEEGFP